MTFSILHEGFVREILVLYFLLPPSAAFVKRDWERQKIETRRLRPMCPFLQRIASSQGGGFSRRKLIFVQSISEFGQ